MELKDINKEILALKGIKICTSCGEQIPVGSEFCPKCGNKVIEITNKAPETATTAEVHNVEEVQENSEAKEKNKTEE